jgi:hypothetical protein
MSHSGLLATTSEADVHRTRRRLIVTRRDPDTGSYDAIGFLDKLDDGFEFRYLARAAERSHFLPMLGFSDTRRSYRRTQLFPSFAERVIGAKRPDRPQYLASLNLDDDAGEWEILSASGGYREGDAIELISLPTFDADTGHTVATFLAHGVRHREPEASERISELKAGFVLGLEPEATNKVNPRAIKIVDRGLHLGYVPDPLVDYVSQVLATGSSTLAVVQSNSPDTNPHLRLLLRLEGTLRGSFPFDGRAWETVTATDAH